MDLVRIPSVSGEESRVMEFAAEYMAKRELRVETLGRGEDHPNVVATLGSGEAPVVVLNGHLDTVPPGALDQWRADPYEPVASDGRIFGLGSLDMKGSCAAMMLVLDALCQHAERLQGTVQLQLVCDEEAGAYYGTPYLAELIEAGELPKPNHVIVGEYTGLKVMTAERGSLKFLVHFYGRTTHTATARTEGQNAIYAAAEGIRLLERGLDAEHPEVGKAVRSVNQIWGGNYRSQVPDECIILVDHRMVPGETMESVLADVTVELEGLVSRIPWLEFEATSAVDERGQPRYVRPNLSARDVPIAIAIRRAHEYVTGEPAEFFSGWFGASDARCFRYAGYEAINYGPGGQYAHGPNEFVIVDTLKTQLSVIAHAVGHLCGLKTIVGSNSPLSALLSLGHSIQAPKEKRGWQRDQ